MGAKLLPYALRNQPKVEATYFEWLASVERITVQRSLSDPQFTFQMDIQDVVTSVMPGLMMSTDRLITDPKMGEAGGARSG